MTSIIQKALRLSFYAMFILIILSKRWNPNHRFAELTEEEGKPILKIEKRLYHLET